jgi:hypothetical protein
MSNLDDMPSIIAGRYVVEREIGQGGMATVLLARDSERNRQVAVKLLRSEIVTALDGDRFFREIEVTREFHHSHILSLLDFGVHEGIQYYVMPFVDGGSLRDRMIRTKQLPIDDAIAIAIQITDAVAYAHARGVLHRDIKPANILLASSATGLPSAYVADFGIALALEQPEADRLTSTGVVVGTPEYMSPEQGAGERRLDERSDVYSLATVLYEMLGGEPPFTGPTVQALIRRKMVVPAPSVQDLRPTVSDRLAAIVARGLERAPADRFQNAKEFLAALRSTATTSTHEPDAPSRRWRPSVRSVVGGGALIAAVVAGLSIRECQSPHRALEEAAAALQDGRFADAERDLRRVVLSNNAPEKAKATAWFAHSDLLLKGDSVTDWKSAAAAAAADSQYLDDHDGVRVRALVALAANDLPHACSAFRTLASMGDRPSALSLMDCIEHDRTVVPDSTSPTRLRFRTDFDEGLRIGRRLLNAVPAQSPIRPLVYRRMLRFLMPMHGPVRTGRMTSNPELAFVAFPTLRRDSLGARVELIPAPVADVIAGRGIPIGASNEQAIHHDAEFLRELALQWTRGFPRDVDAHVALALALELKGELTPLSDGDPAAVNEIRIARAITADLRQRLALAVVEVRLEIKQGAFEEASRVADSSLTRWTTAPPEESRHLAILAALTGRANRAARLLRSVGTQESVTLPNGTTYRPHPDLSASAWSLLGYASLGAPRDSIVELRNRVERQLGLYVAADEMDDVRAALLERSVSLAVPTVGTAAVAGLSGRTTQVIRMQQALASGNRAGVRRHLDSLARIRSSRPAATTTLDEAYQEAWLRAAIGDTAQAIQQLDRTLDALPALPPSALQDVPAAAALGRAMRLRGALAAATGDSVALRRWSAALSALWRYADLPVVAAPP